MQPVILHKVDQRSGVFRRSLQVALVVLAILTIWIVAGLRDVTPHDLRDFDGHEVGRMETEMWRSYYGHHSLRLFGQLAALLRLQYHLSFWRSCLGAAYGARAAVVFQRGHNRADYEKALPDVERFYELIRRSSVRPFDAGEASRAELEWWIIHRERATRPAGDLERSLSALQSILYGKPEGRFSEHSRDRAAAMLLRDREAEAGGVSEQDWRTIADLLDRSWMSLHSAVAQQ
jgi:hypothetical protein